MGKKDASAVGLAFLGFVFLVGIAKGTWKDAWNALMTAPASAGSTGGGGTGGGAGYPGRKNAGYQPGGQFFSTGRGLNPWTGKQYNADPSFNPNDPKWGKIPAGLTASQIRDKGISDPSGIAVGSVPSFGFAPGAIVGVK